uniref:autotransporter-associated beta strand repeat-containing protein n=1 Tax=uncultured Methylobacterium sp. TaxID=157278 RepID=UPI002582A927
MNPAAAGPGIAGPEVTHRRMLALAVPITLANVTTPLLGLVGTAAVGRLGDAALLGALALGAVAFDYLFWTFGALRMATAGLTAQATGAGNVTKNGAGTLTLNGANSLTGAFNLAGGAL